MRAVALLLCALLAGCAGTVRISELNPRAPAVELDSTPFFPQQVNECGPAALATALGASGVGVTPDELAPLLYLPGRRGTLQAEMVAAARRHARVPYPLAPRLEELLATVAGGTPVLVLQNLRASFWPAWHYAVVVGYDGAANTLILRSGTERRKVMSARAFERSWQLAQRWSLAIAPPESPPANAGMVEWLRAASAFEELRQPQLAAKAYLAAIRRWPAEVLPWQVLANLRHDQGDLPGAEQALRAAFRLKPSATTLNNLAVVLLERGCPARARAALDRAQALNPSEPEREALRGTRAQVDAFRGPASKVCREFAT